MVSAVCISHSTGAGGDAVARSVAERLGYRFVDDEVIEQASEWAELAPGFIASVERRKSLMDRVLGHVDESSALSLTPSAGGRGLPADADLRTLIKQVLASIADRGSVVIVSHAASFALTGRDVLRVLVTASPETRTERLSEAKGIDSGASACVSVGYELQLTLVTFSASKRISSWSARLTECSIAPSTVRRSPSGLITRPQSCAQTMRFTQTRPVRRLTSTSAICATTVWLLNVYATPRPVRMSPLLTRFGAGRASHLKASAAALSTAIDRARLKPLSSSVLALRSLSRNSIWSWTGRIQPSNRIEGFTRARRARIRQSSGRTGRR